MNLHTLLHSLSEQETHIRSLLTYLKYASNDELRRHYLAEVLGFFPDAMLSNLQCRYCRRTKYCWRGAVQGFVCGMYFVGHYPDSSILERKMTLSHSIYVGEDMLAETIATAEFIDLLLLCFLAHVNIRILSQITNVGLRNLLFHIFFVKNSPYLLTNDS